MLAILQEENFELKILKQNDPLLQTQRRTIISLKKELETHLTKVREVSMYLLRIQAKPGEVTLPEEKLEVEILRVRILQNGLGSKVEDTDPQPER